MNGFKKYLILFLFAALTAYGVFLIVRFIRLRMKCRFTAEAEVVDVKVHRIKRRKGGYSREYTPIVHFYAHNGREYTAEAKESRKRRDEKGSTISIAYDEEDPEFFYIKGSVSDLISGILITAVGGLFLVMQISSVFTL